MLLVSNIIIYAAKPENAFLIDWLKDEVYVSIITLVEVLGYPGLEKADEEKFMLIFDQTQVLPVDQAVVEKAIEFKRIKKMSLGDAIIAATAFLHGFTLVSRNIKDFNHIEGLELSNPFQI